MILLILLNNTKLIQSYATNLMVQSCKLKNNPINNCYSFEVYLELSHFDYF